MYETYDVRSDCTRLPWSSMLIHIRKFQNSFMVHILRLSYVCTFVTNFTSTKTLSCSSGSIRKRGMIRTRSSFFHHTRNTYSFSLPFSTNQTNTKQHCQQQLQPMALKWERRKKPPVGFLKRRHYRKRNSSNSNIIIIINGVVDDNIQVFVRVSTVNNCQPLRSCIERLILKAGVGNYRKQNFFFGRLQVHPKNIIT